MHHSWFWPMIFSQTSASTQEKLCYILANKFHVHIQNHLPLLQRLPAMFPASIRGDGLGNQTLPLFGDFNWSFCENIFGSTRFFCHFWCISRGGPKNIVFDVFDTRFAHNCFSGVCYWAANEDGIYFTGYDPRNHWSIMGEFLTPLALAAE